MNLNETFVIHRLFVRFIAMFGNYEVSLSLSVNLINFNIRFFQMSWRLYRCFNAHGRPKKTTLKVPAEVVVRRFCTFLENGLTFFSC